MDKYDEEIEDLMSVTNSQFRNLIWDHWTDARPLFQFISKSGKQEGHCGCPSMIKTSRPGISMQAPITVNTIKESYLIPAGPDCITQNKAVLEEFARIQRMCDEELGR